MIKQREYNQTEIGRIPKEWKVVKFKDWKDIDLIMGQSPPGKSYNRKGDGLPFIQGKAEFGYKYPHLTLWTTQPTKIAEEGDILISVRAPVGDVNICPFRLCIGRGLAAIRIKKDSNIFYFYWFRKEKQRIENMGKGSTFKAITKNDLFNLSIPLPPLPEQQKIAEILSTVDEAIEKVDDSIEKTKRLKKGLMCELLTKGIGHKEFKDTEIGRIPKEWELKNISDIAEVKGGKRLPKGHNLVDFRTPYPYIRVVDFKNMGVDIGNVKYLLPETHKIIKRYTISSNDVYISIAGSVGLAGLIPNELDGANLTENAAKLCKLRRVFKDFLAYVLNSQFIKKQIIGFIGKAQQPKLALFRIEKIKLPLPPLPEQKKIAEILSTVDKRLELLRSKKEKLERTKKGLMNELLTGQRRVKILEN